MLVRLADSLISQVMIESGVLCSPVVLSCVPPACVICFCEGLEVFETLRAQTSLDDSRICFECFAEGFLVELVCITEVQNLFECDVFSGCWVVFFHPL